MNRDFFEIVRRRKKVLSSECRALSEEKRGKNFWPRKKGRTWTPVDEEMLDSSGCEWTREEKVLSAEWKESAE